MPTRKKSAAAVNAAKKAVPAKKASKKAVPGKKAAPVKKAAAATREARIRVQSDFPKRTLEEAVAVAQAIEDTNAGSPIPPTDLAIALNISPGSSDWRVLSAAAFKYGLTKGTYQAERMSLTELGSRIVAPTSSEDRVAAMFEAATRPGTFSSMYTMFRTKKIPEATFLENIVVRDMGVPRQHAPDCASVFIENMKFAGVVRTAATGEWLGTEPIGGTRSEEDTATDEAQVLDEDESPHLPGTLPVTIEKPRRNAVFVGHGHNKKPLEQLEKILNEYKIPYKVAVEEANRGRPISSKVAES
jgi:hypothetical protein